MEIWCGISHVCNTMAKQSSCLCGSPTIPKNPTENICLNNRFQFSSDWSIRIAEYYANDKRKHGILICSTGNVAKVYTNTKQLAFFAMNSPKAQNINSICLLNDKMFVKSRFYFMRARRFFICNISLLAGIVERSALFKWKMRSN